MRDISSPNSTYYIAKQNASTRFDFDANKILYEFEDLSITSFRPYTLDSVRFYLLCNSNLIDLETKYYQRPDLLSFDTYGTEQLDWVIMDLNDVFCYEEFILPQIYLPSKDSIISLLDFQLPKKLRKQTVK